MSSKIIDPEFNSIIKDIFKNPQEYLDGKVCDSSIINKISESFLNNLDKEYLKEYFLIKSWVKHSFYNGNILEEINQNNQKIKVPLKNIILIWNAFNENKIEKNSNEKKYYNEIRYEGIPQIIFFLFENFKDENENEFLFFLDDLLNNLKEEMNETFYAMHCARFLGNYINNNNKLNEKVLNYLLQKQSFKDLQLEILFYQLNIGKISNKNILDKIFDLISENALFGPKELIDLSINKELFNIMRFINKKYNYLLTEKQIIKFLQKQKTYLLYDKVMVFAEEFQPPTIIQTGFKKVFNNYKHDRKHNEEKYQFYCKIISYLDNQILLYKK